jgi:glyoxylase-like metal-dependent hydrolase (beta-lactamase superfamily II)
MTAVPEKKGQAMRFIFGAIATAAAFASPALAKPLDYQVIRTSATSMHANMVLAKGEKDAVLIDVPFSRADAYRVVAEILDSGKTLTAVIITHDHPDHFFGLDVLADAFPDAKLLAAPVVVKDMTRSVPIKFDRWSGQLGTNAPRRPVVPQALDSDIYMLEGHALSIIGPMQGDHVRSTIVWDDETKTLIAGDVVYNGMYVWLGEHTPDRYQAWIKVLDDLAAKQPLRVIPGHTRPGLVDGPDTIRWTRDYITNFIAHAKMSKTSKEMMAMLQAAYPEAIDVGFCFLLCVPTAVATGEIPPWDE